MTNDHRHVAGDGTVSTHPADQCPFTGQYGRYNGPDGEYAGKRMSMSGPISNAPLLDSFTDAKGKVHYRRPGS